tara:strand:+ start:225 stop:941 length:717 start_codon:yes stop_codon:yes gene_type:complete
MKKIKYTDSFLPNQPFLNQYYNGGRQNYYIDLFNFLMRSNNIELPKKEFKMIESNRFPISEMATNPVIINFYKFLFKIINPNKILEIGTFVGYSTLVFAKYSQKKAKITTLEKFSEFAEIAVKNFRNNKLDKKIKLINEDAGVALKKIISKKEKFDFIFLDGDKGKYKQFFLMIEKIMSKKCVVVVDNVFFQGDNINKKPVTEKGKGVLSLINYIKKNKKYTYSLIPMYDGMMFIKKI